MGDMLEQLVPPPRRPPHCAFQEECSKHFSSVDRRLAQVERRVKREANKTLATTLVQTLVYAALTIYAIERGAPPPALPVSEAHAQEAHQ